MNILWIVLIGAVLLVGIMVLYPRRAQSTKGKTGLVRPKQLNAGTSVIESKRVEKLSPSDARQWLDDFLVKQQNSKK